MNKPLYRPKVDTHLIESQYVDQTFEIHIAQPVMKKDGSEKFPVLYATDANMNFGALQAFSYSMQGTLIPRYILVGIGYPGDIDSSHAGTLGSECQIISRAKGQQDETPAADEDGEHARAKKGEGHARFLSPTLHTLADFDRSRLAYEDHPRQNRFPQRCRGALDTDANGGDKSIIVFRACGPSQHAEELAVDGSTTGIGTWAFSEAMRKTNYAGNLPTLRATMKALVDEGGYPQDFHIAASRMIREDPEAVSLFSSRG